MSFKTNKFYARYIKIITFLKTAWADWDHDSYEENAFIEKKKQIDPKKYFKYYHFVVSNSWMLKFTIVDLVSFTLANLLMIDS